jgi:prepilin-type N-terminal cleavage/methylation domain-containing protein
VRFLVIGVCSSEEIEDSALDEMKRGFSLVELMIVVAVLGILAAIVVPQFQEHATQAKEAVAKDSLRILRSAIELYTARHTGVPPGYKSDNPQNPPTSLDFCQQLVTECRYISGMPQNPFNKRQDIRMVGNGEIFPPNPTNQFGWVYQPATKTIRLDWSGTDKSGILYYQY